MRVIAEETWRRYVANWRPLALAGLVGLLPQLVMMVLGSILGKTVMIGGLVTLARGDARAVMGMLAGVLSGLLVMLVVLLLVSPIAQGGVIYGVVRVQRGQPASFGELWQAGLRFWGSLFRLNLIGLAVGVGWALIMGLFTLIPIIGFLFVMVVGLGGLPLFIALLGYGSYIIVSEETTASEASSRAFRILTAKFGDLVLTALLYLAYSVVFSVVNGILARGSGGLLSLVLQVFTTPLVALYLATRYERNIAPDMGPPGGQGTFDAGPPPGV